MAGSQSTRWIRVQVLASPTLCVFLVLWFASGVQASYGSRSASAPIGSPTAPPSSYEGGLIANPNPMDVGANSVITGNVRGGKQFRGPVPYGASTSFRAPLGSTDLDSFMRYSAVPDELGRYSAGYEMFYSPTGTVSKIRPGQGGVFTPTSPRVAGGIGQWRPDQPPDVVDLGDLRQSHVSVGETATTLDTGPDAWRRFGYGPIPRTPEPTKQVISDELGRHFTDDPASQQNGRPPTPEEYQRQIEQFRQQLEKVKADASKLEQSLRTGNALPKDAAAPMPSDPGHTAGSHTEVTKPTSPLSRSQPLPGDSRGDADLPLRPASLTPDAAAIEKQAQASATLDAPGVAAVPRPVPAVGAKSGPTAESLLPPVGPQSASGGLTRDAADRTDRIAQLFLQKGQSGTGPSQSLAAGDLLSLRGAGEITRAADKPSGALRYGPLSATGGTGSASEHGALPKDRLRFEETAVPADVDANQPRTLTSKPERQLTGNQTQQEHETLTGLSRERFDRYLKAAELYLRQGQYYRAAESFSLASIYNPNDSRAYLGRGQALFTAGEYVSSAIFLAKAIELDPNRSLAKVDLVNATGGPDLFLRRITDLEQCAGTTGADGLQLLLAYIYFEMDRPEEAKAAIEAAGKASPHSLAADLLRTVVSK